MSEQSFHNDFYAREGRTLFHTPAFRKVCEARAQLFVALGNVNAQSRVLSLGCGTGELERLCAPFAGEIVGMDISSVAVERALKLTGEAELRNVSFRVGDVTKFDSTGESFDSVWAAALLHHLSPEARRQLIMSVRKVLRPGGTVVSMDPNVNRLIRVFRRLVARRYELLHSPDEVEIDPSELLGVYRVCGFTDRSVLYSRFFLDAYAWLFPRTPAWLVALLCKLDRLLVCVPWLRPYSSEFFVVARRPIDE